MKENRRLQRVEKELQHLVAQFLIRGFKERLYGLVTVSRVESNPKIRTAKIYVSVFGSDIEKKKSIETLQENVQDIQNHVNKALRMRNIPRLSIVLDEGLERLLTVESKLRQIALEREALEAERGPSHTSDDE
jgi:ribosome-binding factor A